MLFASPVEVLKAPRLDLLVFYSVFKASRALGRYLAASPPGDIGGTEILRIRNIQYTEKPTTRRSPNTHLCARRHGADLSCQRQGSAPGPWKASCKGRFIFDRFAFEFLCFFAKGFVEKREIRCKNLQKECFYEGFLGILHENEPKRARRLQK